MPALVIEGGASRAAYATGVAASLQAAGLVPDAVYGTSAGGALAAWYAAGQADVGCRTWDVANDRKLWSYRRAFTGRPVFDLARLYHEYYPGMFGMDLDALRRSPFPAHVTATDVDRCEAVHPDITKSDAPLGWVHAGAALPLVSDAPVVIDGRRYVDGGMLDPIPIARAIAEGHREIVAILNRPPGERAPEPEWVVRIIARRFPALEDAARRHHEYHNAAVRLTESPPAGVRVHVIRPTRDTGVSRMTRDVKLLRRAIEHGRRDGLVAAGALGLTSVRPRGARTPRA